MDDSYQRSKIYSIRSHQTDLVYIGSTIQPLHKRLYEHRKHYKRWLNDEYNYTTSYEVIQYDDHYIELVEEYPCNSKLELLRREGQVIRETENCCKIIPSRTKTEWYQDNRDKILEQMAKYYQDNKDKLVEIHANYYQNNREKILEQIANYYQENRDKISKKGKVKVVCECGSEIRKSDLPRHKRTKKHQSYLESLIEV